MQYTHLLQKVLLVKSTLIAILGTLNIWKENREIRHSTQNQSLTTQKNCHGSVNELEITSRKQPN